MSILAAFDDSAVANKHAVRFCARRRAGFVARTEDNEITVNFLTGLSGQIGGARFCLPLNRQTGWIFTL